MGIQIWLADLFSPGHSNEWISGATGAGGAILGSLVTIIWTEWFNHRSRLRDTRARNSAGAFAILHRLNNIYSGSHIVRDHLRKHIEHAKAENSPYLCMIVMPMNRLSGPVEFPVDELWTVAQVGGDKLINSISALDRAFNNLMDLMEMYRIRRSEIWERMIPAHMDGFVGTFEMNPDEYRKLQPSLAELDSLLTQLPDMAERIVIDAFEALTHLVHAPGRPFKPTFEIKLPDPKGIEVTIRAKDAPEKPPISPLQSLSNWKLKRLH